MSLRLTVVDAFTDRPFAGNPAAVCLLPEPRDAAWMQLVAREVNLSETAFLWPIEGGFSLRWFTPEIEVALCGHATLASAHAIWEDGTLAPETEARFHTASGWLTCRRGGDVIRMDFPAIPNESVAPPDGLVASLGREPVEVRRAGPNLLAVFRAAEEVRALSPSFARLLELPVQGVIATAPGDDEAFAFLSRYFAPAAGIPEDPVTGSAHCALGPYWQERLGRADFTAYQASARGGVVQVGVRGDRVQLGGRAVTISRGELLVE